MIGEEILQSLIDEKINDGLFQSYYFNGILYDKHNIVYLKFNKWLYVTVSDDVTKITESEPEHIESFTTDNYLFAYPIVKIADNYSEFNQLIGKKLVRFNELVLIKNIALSSGIRLCFEEEKFIIIYADLEEKMHITFKNDLTDYLTEWNSSHFS